MTQRTHLDDFLRGIIIGRLECGRTKLKVSDELGIAQSVISRLWQRFQDDGNVSRRYSTGRPRVTTPNEDRYLAFTAKRNRRSTASDLSRQLSSATGTTISRQTVYRRLGQIGLYAHRPVRCVPLTATHCRLRLAWSREHILWTPQQWACVMFPTSPALACSLILAGLSYGDHQAPFYGWQRPSSPCKHLCASVVHLDMLENFVFLQLEELQPHVFLQQDGAPPHWGIIVRSSLNDHFTGRWTGRGGPIPWPPRSPDITPLSFFHWGFVKDNVYRRRVSNIDDLKARITTAIASVVADMLAGTWCEIEYRLDILRAMKGAHVDVH
ncbi:Transposable element Tcb1 transposase, partial [Stegodyphus mimosarum]